MEHLRAEVEARIHLAAAEEQRTLLVGEEVRWHPQEGVEEAGSTVIPCSRCYLYGALSKKVQASAIKRI